MMLEHFGLATNPFGIAPKLDFLYRSAAFEESMAHLVYGLDNSEAIVMITGPVGMGKTMAVQSFLAHLGDRYVTALVTNTNVDAKELLKLILDDLGVALVPGADKSDVLIALKNFLIEEDKAGRRTIVVVDEAQNLAREVLEEIRLLTNIGQGDRQPIQLVLVGQPELEAMVRRDDLAQLRQRIRVHYVLAPLSRQELESYVDHRMKVAGGKPGCFTGKALDRVYRFSGGVPRVVNSLCGEALLTAFLADHRRVEGEDVEIGTADKEASAVVVVGQSPAEESVPQHAPRRESFPAPGQQSGSFAERRAAGKPRSGGVRSARLTWSLAAVAAVSAVFLFAFGGMDAIRSFGAGARIVPPGGDAGAPDSPAVAALPVPADSAAMAVRVDSMGAASSRGEDAGMSGSGQSAVAASPGGDEDLRRASGEIEELAAVGAPDETFPDPELSPTYFLHVSSFRDGSRAESLARSLRDKGWTAEVRASESRGVNWYRVNIGPFFERDEAVHTANELQMTGDITYYKVVLLDKVD